MKLSHKIYLAIAFALGVGTLFVVAHHWTERLLSAQAETLREINELETLEGRLDNQLVRAAFQPQFDKAQLDGLFQRLREGIEQLARKPLLETEAFESVQERLAEYRRLLATKADQVDRLNTLDTEASNATTDALDAMRRAFDDASAGQTRHIRWLSWSLSAAFILAIGAIIRLLLLADKEHKALVVLHQRIRQNATTDRLTHLHNRFAFERDQGTAAPGSALFLISLDRFRDINDFYGIDVGDAVLKKIAASLATRFETNPHLRLYFLGGREFGMLAEAHPDQDWEAMGRSLNELGRDLEFRLHGQAVPITLSIAMSRQRPLLATADLTLREVRRTAADFLEFDPGLHLERDLERNMEIARLLAEAVSADRVIPFFQPVFEAQSGRLAYHECLMRISDGEGKLMRPNEFHAVARTGRMLTDPACMMIDKCLGRFAGMTGSLSLNLCLVEIIDRQVTQRLFSHLEQNPDLGPRLILELGVGDEVGDQGEVGRFIERARGYGCRIALDDFGSAASGFTQLRGQPADHIMIDGALANDLEEDGAARAMVRSIIALARELGLRTTANHVHNEQVAKLLREMGADYLQGFHLGKPAAEPIVDAADQGQHAR
jgi:diguanylate cyclase (GGDEF)-like protein